MMESRPHRCIMHLLLEVYPLLNTSECDSKVVNIKHLKDKDIKSSYILFVDGNDLEECLDNLKKKLQDFLNE